MKIEKAIPKKIIEIIGNLMHDDLVTKKALELEQVEHELLATLQDFMKGEIENLNSVQRYILKAVTTNVHIMLDDVAMCYLEKAYQLAAFIDKEE